MDRHKPLILGAVILVIAVSAFYFFMPSVRPSKPKYERESTRVTVDVTKTEFYQELMRGKSSINSMMGGQWVPIPMPIPERYNGKLVEKLLFLRANETITKFTEAIVMDTYSHEAFPTVSSYMKVHARELHDKMPKGKIKVLHDGAKGIIYQFRVPDEKDKDKTEYIEIGKAAITDDGVFSVKYINKGTADLEAARQHFFKFLGKV